MARRTGWCSAIWMTAKPIRARDVRAASAPGERDRVGVGALAREVVLGEPQIVEAHGLGEHALLELLVHDARSSGCGESDSVIHPNFTRGAPGGHARSPPGPPAAARR